MSFSPRSPRQPVAAMLLLAAFGFAVNAAVFSALGVKWEVPLAADWRATPEVLSLLQGREPPPGPRRPAQFALAQRPASTNLRLTVEARPRARSLILVYAWRDNAHFNYAHLSTDTGIAQPVHNGIFHVFGGERVRISSQAGPAAFAQTGRWYHVLLDYNGERGTVMVTVDGATVPALRAVDLSLGAGRFGLGSFDETADFRNLQVNTTP